MDLEQNVLLIFRVYLTPIKKWKYALIEWKIMTN